MKTDEEKRAYQRAHYHANKEMWRRKRQRYEATMREWILPHQAVVGAEDPDALVLEFLQATYDTASRLGSWSRDLERASPQSPVPLPQSWSSS